MNLSDNKELLFVYKFNKINNLLNYVDVYYQKEILKDIKRYTNNVNSNYKDYNHLNESQKKNKTLEILNNYLDTIINDQLNYLIDAYHKDNKNEIIIQSEKKALSMINDNLNKKKIHKHIDEGVNKMSSSLNKTIHFNDNQINYLINDKIKEFFSVIKKDLYNEIDNTVNRKIENSWSDTNKKSSEYIQKKIKDFLKVFLKNDKIYNDISNQINNELEILYNKFNVFENQQQKLEILINNYIKGTEDKINNIENNIFKKVDGSLRDKIKILTEIFNSSIKSSFENININQNKAINEKELINKIEKTILNQTATFSKNNFNIIFNKDENEIELYYFNEKITSTKLNIKGLIGPKGPQGSKGDKGDITIIRKIDINENNTMKFTMQNGNSIYEVNTNNILPKGPKGDKGNHGEKGDPGDVNINLKWNQDKIMKLNKENDNNLIFLKSLSIGENAHCLKNNALSIGNSKCYKENSISLGKNSKTFDTNSIALFGNTLGKNAFSYFAEDVDENCFVVGNKHQMKYNIEKIILKSKKIELDCEELILNDNDFKNKKILDLEKSIEKINKELNELKKNN
jgi:hypothetical protein